MTTTSARRRILIIILLLLVLSAALYLFGVSRTSQGHYPVLTLSDDWTITQNDTVLPATRPEQALTHAAQKGDVFLLECTLPSDEIPSAALYLFSAHAILDVYVDNQLIYSYGVRYLERTMFVPKGYHLLALPGDYAGKTLTLRYTATERDAFDAIPSPVIGNVHDLIRNRIAGSILVIATGVFLALFGFLLALMSFLIRMYENRGSQMFLGGLLAMNLGFYALCYYHAFFFVTTNLWWSTTIECITQFLMPVIISAFMRLTTTDRRILLVFNVLLIFSAVVSAMCILAQIMGIFPLTQSMLYYQRLSVILGVVTVFFGLRILRRRLLQFRRLRASTASVSGGLELSSGMILLVGIFVVLFSILFETLDQVLLRYSLRGGASTHYVSLFGMAVYAFLIMMSYFYHAIGVTYEQSQNRMLETLAYTDALTGLPNRAYCRRVLDTLAESGRGYCVISMDVNYLKEVNDTKGHAAGDELLKNFADVLRTSFRSSDVVGRLSGDEFIAILRGASLAESLEKARIMAVGLPFSISYGCAHSSEVRGANATEVYTLADRRMYEMKQEVHIAHA